MIDIHLHTRFSFDSSETPENYIERARNLGVDVLGFSEHYDYDAYLDGAEDVTLADIKSYVNYVNGLHGKIGDTQLLCGVEFGYRAEAVEKYRDLTDEYPFDYVINSVHTLKDRGDCYHDSFFEGKSTEECYRDYFKAVLESVKADYDYQIIGHLGYVSRYRKGKDARIVYARYAELIDEIFKEIIARDKCLEINTSVGCSGAEFLPDCDAIKRYVDLGGKMLSFGSDAHSAQNYLKNAQKLKDFLKSIGVNELYYYKNRLPVSYKI